MKLAMIERDSIVAKALSEAAKELPGKWEGTCFKNPEDFLENSEDFDAVLIDEDLEEINDLIEKIQNMDDVEIAVMSGHTQAIPLSYVKKLEHFIQNSKINAVVDKKDKKGFIQWLKYAYVKKRLQNTVRKENIIYSDLVSKRNGCNITNEDGVVLLGISKLIGPEAIAAVIKSVKAIGDKLLISFDNGPDNEDVGSSHVGLLVTLYEHATAQKIKMAVLIDDTHRMMEEILNMVSVNRLFPAFRTKEEAIGYLKG